MKKGIVLTCAEPRHQDPKVRLFEAVLEVLQSHYEVETAYKVSLGGIDGILSKGKDTHRETLYDQVDLLKGAAESGGSLSVIAVVGHENCAGNSVSDDEHYQDVTDSCMTISERFGVPVIGLFASRVEGSDSHWELSVVCRSVRGAVNLTPQSIAEAVEE